MPPDLDRRQLLRAAALSGSALLAHPGWLRAAQGERLGVVPFLDQEGVAFGEIHGHGLSGRLIFDLAGISHERQLVPNDELFIRTRYPDRLRPQATWTVTLGGAARVPVTLSMAELEAEAEEMGPVVLECSGNGAHRAFGLLGAACFRGVPLSRLLERVTPASKLATLVEVLGFDRHSRPGGGSVPGASWIFAREHLEQTGAFLATAMNGEPVPRDHGEPVRLVVPGWYGCSCIKWVQEIRLVATDAEATSQMREFAGRTHQQGVPDLAREYRSSRIELAALPVRIEKWAVQGEIEYRVFGVVWGGVGRDLTAGLQIQLQPGGERFAVDLSRRGPMGTGWDLWQHRWRPREPGRYTIRLATTDSEIPTRRLDVGHYDRSVLIDEV